MSFDKSPITQGLSAWGEKIKAACRPAAFAASTVLWEEMRLRVPVKDGTLRDSIYRYRDKSDDDFSQEAKSTFTVGPNKVKAPHWYLIEFGHFRHYRVYQDKAGDWHTIKSEPLATPVWVPAQPYIRPSFDAKINQALETGLRVLAQKIKEPE